MDGLMDWWISGLMERRVSLEMGSAGLIEN
jgi:hypothetical protein